MPEHDCTKCFRPVPAAELVERRGSLWHKRCAPPSAGTVYVAAVEALPDLRIRRVTVAVPAGQNVTRLNAVLRRVAAGAGGAVWDKNFGAPRKDYAGKRVNAVHLPLEGRLPELALILAEEGFEVRTLEAGK